MKDEHEIVAQILEYRMLSKLNGTYVEGMLPMVHADGKIHDIFSNSGRNGRIMYRAKPAEHSQQTGTEAAQEGIRS